ncbi:MAG: tetratricopeptide repeat protein, partial [Planctomycetaceae bacterium]
LANSISAVPTSTGSEEAETHLREALRLYSDLEHDFPERPQATGNSLKMLADVMTNRGDLVEAERLYRQAIAQLESYVKVAPNANTWLDLNRARFTLVSRFLDDLGTGFRPLESERLYQEALDATEQGLKIDPQATRLRHARAQTRTELGQLYQVTDQPDKAISLLRQSMQESQELCEQSPWVHAYWIEMRDAQQSLIAQLQSSGHSEELKLLDRRVYEWLLEIVPRIPVAAVPQMELSTSLVRHINRLTSTGQEREGNELARIASDLGSRVANNLHDTSGDRIAMATIRLFSCSLAMLASDQNEAIETEETRRLFRQAATLHNELTSSADYADRLSVSEFYLELGRRLAYTPNSVQELSDVHREHLLLLQGLLQDFPDSRNCRTNVGHQLRWWSGVFSQNDAYAAHKEEALRVAIDVFDKLTVDFPKDLNAWHWLTETRRGFGSVLERNGKSEEAEVQYRRIAGDWNAAIEGLGKSLELRNGSAGIDGFFLAIAHQQLGHHDEARKWYDQAVAWMEKNQPHDEQLRRFRTEAEELLKITEEKPTTKSPVEVK